MSPGRVERVERVRLTAAGRAGVCAVLCVAAYGAGVGAAHGRSGDAARGGVRVWPMAAGDLCGTPGRRVIGTWRTADGQVWCADVPA